MDVVKEVIVDRYKGDFEMLKKQINPSTLDLPEKHIIEVESLIKRAAADLINALHKIGKIDEAAFKSAASHFD